MLPNRLKTKLESVRHLAITTDLWTSIAHHAYMGVTGHYVDDAGTLQSCLLDCVELPADEHSAADIASALQDRFDKIHRFWQIFSTVSSFGEFLYRNGSTEHNGKMNSGSRDNSATSSLFIFCGVIYN